MAMNSDQTYRCGRVGDLGEIFDFLQHVVESHIEEDCDDGYDCCLD